MTPDIDWRTRPLATLAVALFWLAFIALCGLAGGMDVAGR